MNEYAVEVEGVSKQFRETLKFFYILTHPFKPKMFTALDNISLKVKKGEIFGIIGPNGAGKTTLLRIISTLLSPDSGEVRVCGLSQVKDELEVRSKIGLIRGEERGLYWRLTVRQNLEFFGALADIPQNELNEKVERIVKVVALERKIDEKVGALSSGMKQRTDIARALLHDPEILLMDEPTKSLDPISAADIRNFIKEDIVKKEGKTVIISTHNLNEAISLCNRIAIMDNAKVIKVGTYKELQERTIGKKHLTMVLMEEPMDMEKELRGVPGILNVSQERSPSGVTNYTLTITNEEEVLPKLMELITSTKTKLLSIATTEASLEEIFQKAVKGGMKKRGELRSKGKSKGGRGKMMMGRPF